MDDGAPLRVTRSTPASAEQRPRTASSRRRRVGRDVGVQVDGRHPDAPATSAATTDDRVTDPHEQAAAVFGQALVQGGHVAQQPRRPVVAGRPSSNVASTTKRASTRRCSAVAAAKAGLSSRRRSRRNHTIPSSSATVGPYGTPPSDCRVVRPGGTAGQARADRRGASRTRSRGRPRPARTPRAPGPTDGRALRRAHPRRGRGGGGQVESRTRRRLGGQAARWPAVVTKSGRTVTVRPTQHGEGLGRDGDRAAAAPPATPRTPRRRLVVEDAGLRADHQDVGLGAEHRPRPRPARRPRCATRAGPWVEPAIGQRGRVEPSGPDDRVPAGVATATTGAPRAAEGRGQSRAGGVEALDGDRAPSSEPPPPRPRPRPPRPSARAGGAAPTRRPGGGRRPAAPPAPRHRRPGRRQQQGAGGGIGRRSRRRRRPRGLVPTVGRGVDPGRRAGDLPPEGGELVGLAPGQPGRAVDEELGSEADQTGGERWSPVEVDDDEGVGGGELAGRHERVSLTHDRRRSALTGPEGNRTGAVERPSAPAGWRPPDGAREVVRAVHNGPPWTRPSTC